MKKEAIQQHIKSVAHQKAVDTKKANDLQAKNKPTPIEKGFQKLDEHILTKMDRLFRTAYYLVKKEGPFTDFPDILELQKLNGASELGDTYFNDKAAKEFISEIAGFHHDELKTFCTSLTTLVYFVMDLLTSL